MKQHLPKIAAGEFKAKCLELMDQVHATHTALIITKREVPIAKLVPFEKPVFELFGAQENAVTIRGDIVSSVDEH